VQEVLKWGTFVQEVLKWGTFGKGVGVEIRPFHLIIRVDNLVQFLGQLVDLKFRPER